MERKTTIAMARELVDMESQNLSPKKEPSTSILNKVTRPVVLKFEDVVYKVKPLKDKGCLNCKTAGFEETVILTGISGVVSPGEMLAMLGPSGSGKTTLLTALGGRLSGNLSGNITYNGNPYSNTMKRNTGFVPQDDILYPHLTVTETLIYTALLRLSNNLTTQEKKMHAEVVISQLGLTKCKDSIIGGHFLRGISGGERKRVSIGQEMLINPSLLFLDEPTSGLDSTTAQRIVSTLWELAKGGRTVVMTIHQPSSRLFYMFHKVLLLSDGNSLYFGEGGSVMEYFSSIGYEPPVAMNPSDFLLDLANGISCDDWENKVAVKQALVSSYKNSLEHTVKEEIKEISNLSTDTEEDKDSGRWNTTWWQQFSVLLRRGVKERRHESFSGRKISQVLVVALLCGMLWWQSKNIQDKVGLLFFYAGFWGFFPLFQAIFTFPQERKMLTKERASGMYRLSSYFMARIVGDLPLELILPTTFVTITYFMAGLKLNAGNYFETLFVLLYSVVSAQGLGLAIGAVVMDLKSAATLGSVIALSFLLAGGYYVQHVPVFIRWIKYISFSQYTYKLLMGSQFKVGDTYACGQNTTCPVAEFPMLKTVGLDHRDMAFLALAIMIVGYRVIAYLALMRIGVKH